MNETRNIEIQEMRDFQTVSLILDQLFGKKLLRVLKRPEFSPSDVLFSAGTIDNMSKYSLEIKETKKDFWKSDGGFLLKISKFISILVDSRERDPEEKIYIVYLTNDNRYYFFDLAHLDLNTVRKENKKIKITEFKNTQRIDTPVIILNPEASVCHGHF